jgi:alkanesulfonate monooxygenase SsuD/methylene tetrahydromethanopterin reductase-like flavin-dependent oxidoreductase (luciferase family)
MAGDALRFGVLVLQDAPLPELVGRWRLLEQLEFDALYVADHTADYRDVGGYWLEGWTVLTAMAQATERVRIGTLVSNPILRHPALLAKAAAAVDNVSGGRLELGIGTGIAGFDHAAMGVPYWPIKERLARFAEYVEVVDGVLRSDGTYSFAGRFMSTENTAMNPRPVQRPRPPITLAGQSPSVLKVAARRADCWNTHGPFGASGDEILALTARQNRRLDGLCAEQGRDPRQVRRSLLMLDPLDAWSAADAFERIVSQFAEAGIREFVAFWPPEDRMDLLERVAGQVIPALRR